MGLRHRLWVAEGERIETALCRLLSTACPTCYANVDRINDPGTGGSVPGLSDRIDNLQRALAYDHRDCEGRREWTC